MRRAKAATTEHAVDININARHRGGGGWGMLPKTLNSGSDHRRLRIRSGQHYRAPDVAAACGSLLFHRERRVKVTQDTYVLLCMHVEVW